MHGHHDTGNHPGVRPAQPPGVVDRLSLDRTGGTATPVPAIPPALAPITTGGPCFLGCRAVHVRRFNADPPRFR